MGLVANRGTTDRQAGAVLDPRHAHSTRASRFSPQVHHGDKSALDKVMCYRLIELVQNRPDMNLVGIEFNGDERVKCLA